MVVTSDGTVYVLQAWQEDKGTPDQVEDAWVDEAYGIACRLGQAVVVTQGGSLVCVIQPK